MHPHPGADGRDHLSRSNCLDMRCTAIVLVNLRASEMREVGRYHPARASRGNTETSADFGCLNITFLVSFSSSDRSISKHPILKPEPGQRVRHGNAATERASWPQENLGISLVYLAEVAGLISYTSAVSSGKCDGK